MLFCRRSLNPGLNIAGQSQVERFKVLEAWNRKQTKFLIKYCEMCVLLKQSEQWSKDKLGPLHLNKTCKTEKCLVSLV